MRVTSKGQVTIPRDLRDLAGIQPNTEVVFALEDGKIVIFPKDNPRDAADRERLAGFLDALDRLEGSGDQSMTTAEVMAMTRDR